MNTAKRQNLNMKGKKKIYRLLSQCAGHVLMEGQTVMKQGERDHCTPSLQAADANVAQGAPLQGTAYIPRTNDELPSTISHANLPSFPQVSTCHCDDLECNYLVCVSRVLRSPEHSSYIAMHSTGQSRTHRWSYY